MEKSNTSLHTYGIEYELPRERRWVKSVLTNISNLDSLKGWTDQNGNNVPEFSNIDIYRCFQGKIFAIPREGQIILCRSFIHKIESEDELAFLIGHELAHILFSHQDRRFRKETGYKLTGENPLAGLMILGGLVAGGPVGLGVAVLGATVVPEAHEKNSLKQSRAYDKEDELQADTWGIKLASEAGYNPTASMRLIDRLSNGEDGNWEHSRHPDTTLRLQRLSKLIAEKYSESTKLKIRAARITTDYFDDSGSPYNYLPPNSLVQYEKGRCLDRVLANMLVVDSVLNRSLLKNKNEFDKLIHAHEKLNECSAPASAILNLALLKRSRSLLFGGGDDARLLSRRAYEKSEGASFTDWGGTFALLNDFQMVREVCERYNSTSERKANCTEVLSLYRRQDFSDSQRADFVLGKFVAGF